METNSIDRPLSRKMMDEADAALAPVIARYRAYADPSVAAQLDEGMITGCEFINHVFERLNPSDDHAMEEADHPHD